MIIMVEKNSILIRYYRDGESKSSISRVLKISRKTVRKYIEEHERQISDKSLPNHLEIGLSTKPKYNGNGREKRKLTNEIEEEIKDCLNKNREKRNQGLRKQLMKKIDIHEYLLNKDYQVGYTTVCNYIRDSEKSGKESFIKQIYQPGKICEFDWGEVKVKICDKLITFNLAVFTSAYSNYRWAKLFHRQDTLAFSQSHIDFFSHTGSVYREMVYDNMRVAVARFIGRTEKEATTALLELSNYYKFGYRFCNIRKGNEKGHVERSVEYVRRKAFSVKDEFSSLEQANEYLLQTCERLNNTSQKLKNDETANQMYEQEVKHLYKTRISYKCFDEEYAKVDKYSTVILYGNRYSVPDFLVGRLLDIKVFAEKIDVYLKAEEVCSHKRSYGSHTWTLDINHYLTTLSRKPGALVGSLAFEQLSEDVKNIYSEYFYQSNKDFIELLQYCKNKTIDFGSVKSAIEKIKKITPTSISKDKILAVIGKIKEDERSSISEEREANEIEQYAGESLKELSDFLLKM